MASIALVDTAREGLLWEVLDYNTHGEEVGGRFNTELEAINFKNWLEGDCLMCNLSNRDCFCAESL